MAIGQFSVGFCGRFSVGNPVFWLWINPPSQGKRLFLSNSQGFRGMITGFPENIPEGSTNSGE